MCTLFFLGQSRTSTKAPESNITFKTTTPRTTTLFTPFTLPPEGSLFNLEIII